MAFPGVVIILLLLGLILSKKVSALAALTCVPIVVALLAGFGLDTFSFAVKGIQNIAPVAAMFIFAIIFFGVLTDAGMFDPIINRILRMVKNHPARITMGAALLAMIVHLDGSGAVTFLITIPAILPLFEKLNMDKRVLAAVVALGAGTMNMVPWGGPTIRAATALGVEVTDLYRPIMIPQIAGLIFVLLVAYYLGKREQKRLGIKTKGQPETTFVRELTEEEKAMRRPKLFWCNILLTIATIVVLISGIIPPVMAFMIGTILALMINYPRLKEQRDRVDAHSKAAILMASILLAAGVFTGIMKESGMISAMAGEAAELIPQRLGQHVPAILSVISMPLSFFLDPDSYYFGFLPVMASAGSELGLNPLSLAHASLLGQMTTGFPLSPLTPATFLLIGLTKIDLADHQRFTFKYAFLTTLVMAIVSVIMGIFPL
jgi:CitMHS family citrate-Mg2+:H+ or citrate-Ca2+:H+ symporter